MNIYPMNVFVLHNFPKTALHFLFCPAVNVRMKISKKNIALSLFVFLILASCRNLGLKLGKEKQSFQFAGYQWKTKIGEERQGPGNNKFSAQAANLRVDWRGYLHLNIRSSDSLWYSTEIICQTPMGYGRYEIEIKGLLSNLDPYSVLGFFTWDPKNFGSQANSEIDIEFSKWGYPLSPSLLYYTAHPVSNGKLNLERMYKSPHPTTQWDGISTHVIEWRDTSITWHSYTGKQAALENRTDYFHYSYRNKKRLKKLGEEESNAISVPKPGEQTSARINYWLLLDQDQPLSGKCPEIIIRDFKFEAY